MTRNMPLFRRRDREDSESELESASVATFEFDMENVVRDSFRKLERGHKRRRPISHISDSGSQSGAVVETMHALKDSDDSELDVLLDSSNPTDELDRSTRSLRTYGSSVSSSGISQLLPNRTMSFSILIGTFGFISSTLFLGFGVSSAVDEQEGIFVIRANEVIQKFNRTWSNYITASRWVHQACAFHPISRTEFLHVYEYLAADLEVQAVEWLPKVLDANRSALEQEARESFEMTHPEIGYHGIVGFEPDDPSNPESPTSIQNRSQQEFYYPIHFIEPINEMNINLLEFDLLSTSMNKETLELALETWQPAATEAYQRPLPDGGFSEDQYVQLIHPGLPLMDLPDQQPRDVSALIIRIQTVLETATQYLPSDLSIFLYDATNEEEEPEFLLGAEVYKDGDEETGERILYLSEISLDDLLDDTVFFMTVDQIPVASRTWTVAIVALEDTFVPRLGYIVMAGKFILVASLCISLWILTNFRRTRTILEVKRKADVEKTQVIIRSARENAKAEQELNDYIAHEVRNPLSAAMSACTFVRAAVNEQNPMADKESIEAVREDVEIIDSSLTFTHDLLRSMLDMHRAATKSLIIDQAPLDVMKDVLEPVVAMLYKRDMQFKVLCECPQDLVMVSDRLRLKQILLNLCRNATRYVQKGFVKVGAAVVDGNIQLYVEDSGYGISEDRKKKLFSKFQESLEVMDQGSGVGLCLCRSMANLLKGDIWLDENFDSGVEGFPGTRFVLDLKKGPYYEDEIGINYLDNVSEHTESVTTPGGSKCNSESSRTEGVFFSGRLTTSKKVLRKSTSVDFLFAMEDPNSTALTSTPPMESAPPATVSSSVEPPAQEFRDGEETQELPDKLSILFVDDDMILRKLFMRSVKKVFNTWDIQEASSGESALKLVQEQDFDLIFMDQYMSSVEKQLLGTETTRVLRSKGNSSRICGLSANDVEQAFWTAGADSFMFKPFPCKKEELKEELVRLLRGPRHPKVQAVVAGAATCDVPHSTDSQEESSSRSYLELNPPTKK